MPESAPAGPAVFYLTFAALPSPAAHSVQILKMCQAMAEAGSDVILAADLRLPPPRVFEMYGIRRPFPILALRVLPVRVLGRTLFLLRSLPHVYGNRRRLFYARDVFTAFFVRMLNRDFVFELHELPSGLISGALMKSVLRAPRLRAAVFISEELRKLAASRLSARSLPKRILVAHDGADLEEFKPSPSLEASRRSLGLPAQAFLAGYAGSLFEGRGIEIILETARRLRNVTFLIVGGEGDQAHRLKRRAGEEGFDNLFVAGFVPHGRIPAALAACDVLLMPYQRAVLHRQKKRDTAATMSPLKAFEYMAAGKPIVSSRLKVLAEILTDGRNALFVRPEDPAEWAAAIGRLKEDAGLRRKIGEQARGDVRKYAWEERVKAIFREVHGYEH